MQRLRQLRPWSRQASLGHTPKGAYSTRWRSRHLLETSFSEPLLRTLLRTLFYCKTHSRPPSQNPSENPFPRTFSEPFSERCVAVRPLRRAPYSCDLEASAQNRSIAFSLRPAKHKTLRFSTTEWLRAHSRLPWSLPSCDASFVPASVDMAKSGTN